MSSPDGRSVGEQTDGTINKTILDFVWRKPGKGWWFLFMLGLAGTGMLTPAELAEYQPLFDNAKKVRALLAELQDLTLEIIETDSQQP